jgi:hypothetical protein
MSFVLLSVLATGVVDTGGDPWLANISANFRKIRNGPNAKYSGVGGKPIHEKKPEARNLVTLSL